MRAFGLAASRIRLAAAIALAAFAVHQLRYLLAFGGGSSEELAQRGHGYLETVLPGIAVLGLAILAATVLGAIGGPQARRSPVVLRALACAAALLSIFLLQELLEWAVAPERQVALATALVGAGAWVALPLSVAFGAAVSLLLGGLESVERVLAVALAAPSVVRSARTMGAARPASGVISLRAPLAFGLARRPPPLVA